MSFKVAVLVKQVPDHEALVRIRSDQELDIEDRHVCSFYDEIAIEAALTLKKAHSDIELTAVSAGGRRAVDALRRALAMGIDQAEHLGDESLDGAPSLAVASVLAARLSALQPSLILCGKQAGHDDQGAVGPMVARLMDVPHISAAVSLELDPSGSPPAAAVGRKLEGEIWTLNAPLPVVVTAEKGLAEPHIPVVTRVMKAMKAKIPNTSIQELGAGAAPAPDSLVRRLRYQPPPTRPEVTMMKEPFPGNVDELVKRLMETGVLS